MKRLLATICLLACLFIVSGCEGTVGKLMSGIRNGWDRLHGKGPAEPDPEPGDFTKVDDVPGAPLTAEEKTLIAQVEAIRKIANDTDMRTPARDNQVDAEMQKLDKIYPPQRPPVNRATINQGMDALFPKKIGDFTFAEGSISGQEKGYHEELIPDLDFDTDANYLGGYRLYRKSKDTRLVVSLIDRGNLAQWVRTAHWYYVRKGAVGTEEQQRFKFVETIEKNGRSWVVWQAKQTGKKFIMHWHGRWQIWVDGVENTDDLNELFASKWLDTM